MFTNNRLISELCPGLTNPGLINLSGRLPAEFSIEYGAGGSGSPFGVSSDNPERSCLCPVHGYPGSIARHSPAPSGGGRRPRSGRAVGGDPARGIFQCHVETGKGEDGWRKTGPRLSVNLHEIYVSPPRYGHRVNCRTLPAGHPAGRPWIDRIQGAPQTIPKAPDCSCVRQLPLPQPLKTARRQESGQIKRFNPYPVSPSRQTSPVSPFTVTFLPGGSL